MEGSLKGHLRHHINSLRFYTVYTRIRFQPQAVCRVEYVVTGIVRRTVLYQKGIQDGDVR
jgi:hypothetical protein